MKKTWIRMIALALLAVVALACFAGCSKKLSGTYRSGAEVAGKFIGTSLKFSGSKVEITVDAAIASVTVDGTYEITETEKDGEKVESIKFGFSAEDQKKLEEKGIAIKLDAPLPFAETENGIMVGIVPFTKQ